MPAPTPTGLIARYPEFAQADTDTVGLVIDEAAMEVDARAWGKFYAVGVLALAAHMLSIQSRRGGTGAGALPGPVTGKKVGEIQFNYAAPPVANSDEAMLSSTAYGQRYLQLRRLVAIPIRVVA